MEANYVNSYGWQVRDLGELIIEFQFESKAVRTKGIYGLLFQVMSVQRQEKVNVTILETGREREFALFCLLFSLKFANIANAPPIPMNSTSFI